MWPLPLSVLFLLGWLWFHRIVVHRGVRDLLDSRGGTSPLTTWAVVIETFALATLCLVAAYLPLHEPSTALLIAGNLGAAGACAVGLWARRTLGQHFSIHLTTDPAEGHDLVTSGPYRWVRHPVYTGDLLFQIALLLIANVPEGFVLVVIYFLLVRSRMETEEQMLSSEYADYAPYMERSHRLIPYIY